MKGLFPAKSDETLGSSILLVETDARAQRVRRLAYPGDLTDAPWG
jgi:hypothetical protein